MGTLAANVPFNVWGTFFLGGDAGGRVSRRWYVGTYGVSAFPFTKGCPVGGTCLEFDLAFGGAVGYHLTDLRDHGGWDPSLVLGVGYEAMFAGGPNVSPTYQGLQYKVQLNVDYLSLHHGVRPRPADALGLFLALAGGDVTSTGDTGNPWHAWLSLGLRVTWDLGR